MATHYVLYYSATKLAGQKVAWRIRRKSGVLTFVSVVHLSFWDSREILN